VDQERLLDRRPDAEPRVERLVRVLVDDLHPAAERTQLAWAERHEVATVEADRPGDRIDEPQHRLGGRRLAAARLADEGEHLSPPQRQRDPLDGVHATTRLARGRSDEAAVDRVADDEILDLEQRRLRAHAGTRELRWQAAS
jgi:hypothetical protein